LFALLYKGVVRRFMNGKKLEELSEKQLLMEIYKISRRTRRYMVFQTVLSVIKLLFIVVPIIFALIFIPPLIREFVPKLQNTMKSFQPPTLP